MKTYPHRKKFIYNIESLLNRSVDVNYVLQEIRKIYSDIAIETPCMTRFSFDLVDTESLRNVEFYQIPSESLSNKSIEISHTKLIEYIWLEDGEWCYGDTEYGAQDIATALSEATFFKQYPETVKDLQKLLNDGLWVFEKSRFPSFGDARFSDFDEVLSWDEKHVMVGTTLENAEVVSIEEWNRITTNESSWLK